ncbi:extensin family protein [Phaeovulum sp. W22_SRMD_FR3]
MRRRALLASVALAGAQGWGRGAAVVLLALLPLGALAAGLEQSPRPQPRPASETAASTSAAVLTVPASALSLPETPGGVQVSLAPADARRPAPRPDDLVQPAVAAPDGALAVSARPVARPVLNPEMTVVAPDTDHMAAAAPAQTAPAPKRGGLASLFRAPAKPGAAARSAPSGEAVDPIDTAAVGAMVARPGQTRGQLCGIAGLEGAPIPPIPGAAKGCGLADGVQVTRVSGIPLSIPVQVDCTTAIALKTWVDKGIVPSVGKTGGGLARLEIAGSYACRPRNHQSGAKISEHGRGHAVDLRGIKLNDGRVIDVASGWRSQAKLMQAIHRTACGPFGTVLGPKSDAFHKDHIHVDTASYRSGNYCR